MDRLINSIENLVQTASGKLQPTIILAIANLLRNGFLKMSASDVKNECLDIKPNIFDEGSRLAAICTGMRKAKVQLGGKIISEDRDHNGFTIRFSSGGISFEQGPFSEKKQTKSDGRLGLNPDQQFKINKTSTLSLNMSKECITHKFQDIMFEEHWNTKTLILGTFNPEIGSNADYFYGRFHVKGGWSNRFWGAINLLSKSNNLQIPEVKSGDKPSKIDALTRLNWKCLDILNSIQTDTSNLSEITGNGFADKPLFSRNNTRVYNTSKIIEWIDLHPELENVIASWGKGSPMNKECKKEISRIEEHLRKKNVKSNLFALNAFSRSSYKEVTDDLVNYLEVERINPPK